MQPPSQSCSHPLSSMLPVSTVMALPWLRATKHICAARSVYQSIQPKTLTLDVTVVAKQCSVNAQGVLCPIVQPHVQVCSLY